MRSLYAVRFGFFKTTIISEDGREQLTGFQMAGEMLGIDAISDDRHVCNAEERMAAFLLNLSNRMKHRSYSPTAFVLRMTREDIGSYLGLRLETIYRAIGYLRDNAIVRISGRAVEILDLERLKLLIHGCSHRARPL